MEPAKTLVTMNIIQLLENLLDSFPVAYSSPSSPDAS